MVACFFGAGRQVAAYSSPMMLRLGRVVALLFSVFSLRCRA
jgi:hypothetical protein